MIGKTYIKIKTKIIIIAVVLIFSVIIISKKKNNDGRVGEILKNDKK